MFRIILFTVFLFEAFKITAQNETPIPIDCWILENIQLQTIGSSVVDFSHYSCIRTSETNPPQINGANKVTITSGNNINLKPGFEVSNLNGSGQFHGKIQSNNLDISVFHPNTPGEVGKWEKFELGLNLPNSIKAQINNFFADLPNGINPFAEEDISVEATFTAPSGNSKVIYGFYYKPYSVNSFTNQWVQGVTDYDFRIRFAPDEIGIWKLRIKVIANNQVITSNNDIWFRCIPSAQKGNLIRASNSSFLKYENGESFFAIGENITHSAYYSNDFRPSTNDKHIRWLTELASNGGNFTRIENGAQNFLIDWENINEYSGRMDRMWAFDRIVDKCEELGIYFIFFNHHVEFHAREADCDLNREIQWANNPYNTTLGLISVNSYFTDAQAIYYFKRRMRYILSRWGYSTKFSMIEFSEVDNIFGKTSWGQNCTDGDDDGDIYYHSNITPRIIFQLWFNNIKNYVQNSLGYNKKFLVASFANNFSDDESLLDDFHIYEYSDLVFVHKYGEDKNINHDRFDLVREVFDDYPKPVLVEEMGVQDGWLYCCTDIDFHNDIWATSFMGTFGCGMNWWWDRGIHDKGYYVHFKALAKFFENESISDRGFFPEVWVDKANKKKRKLEVFYLTESNKEYVIGWAHNATYYWNNLKVNNSCISDLLLNDNFLQPCVYEDGYVQGYPNQPHSLNYKNFVEDDYGVPLNLNSSNKFQIHNLKPNLINSSIFPRHHYKITWWFTWGNGGPTSMEQTVTTNAFGKAEFNIPEMYFPYFYPDYAFKIEYLGRYRMLDVYDDTNSIMQDSIPIIWLENESDFVNIFPNPSSGGFHIQSNSIIIRVKIFAFDGRMVEEFGSINGKNFAFPGNLIPGIYFVQIDTDNGQSIKKLIVQ